MKKYEYTNIENYIGMDIEKELIGEKKVFNILNEIDAFKLFFSDDILTEIDKETNKYYKQKLISQYGQNYEIKNFSKNTLPWYYLKRGISKKDILLFIA